MSKILRGGVQTNSTFRKVIALILTAIVVLSLTGCPSPTDDTPCNTPGNGTNPPTTTYIGTKAPGTYAIGDIVFNDGSATPYSAELDLTGKTDKAIAVIFRATSETEPALGVGIKHSYFAIWCDYDAKGFTKKFSTNESVTDGSNTLQKMALELGEENDTGITVTDETAYTYTGTVSDAYDAFKFAYCYGTAEGHNISESSEYKDGWYLPSIAELGYIGTANQSNLIANAISKASGDTFSTNKRYWSSSQSDEEGMGGYSKVFYYQFDTNMQYQQDKNYGTDAISACAIRAFN